MAEYGDWHKDPDGQWRHPRYPKGGDRQHPEVEAGYCRTHNGAWLNIDGKVIELNFNELGFLLGQLIKANQTAQAENSRLWKEKEAIMIAEDGYVPPVYGYKGRRIN